MASTRGPGTQPRFLDDRLSVTLVHCGQTVGWIKVPLGMQVGLDPGHIVLYRRATIALRAIVARHDNCPK